MVYFINQFNFYLELCDDPDYQWAFQKLKTYGKTFYFVSFFLPPEKRKWIVYYYAYCRITDDMIDESNNPVLKLSILKEYIQCAYQKAGIEMFFNKWSNELTKDEMHGMKIYNKVIDKFKIPRTYSELLIEGYEHDALKKDIKTSNELLHYSTCVAGSVGMIICLLFGITSDKILNGAKAYGTALQLTNISRDIITDALIDRIYIPLTILKTNPSTFLESVKNKTISDSELRYYAGWCVKIADEHYQKGIDSLKFLPFTLRYAFLLLGMLYREIGIKIINNKKYEKRTFLTLREKIYLVPKIIWNYAVNHSLRIEYHLVNTLIKI